MLVNSKRQRKVNETSFSESLKALQMMYRQKNVYMFLTCARGCTGRIGIEHASDCALSEKNILYKYK